MHYITNEPVRQCVGTGFNLRGGDLESVCLSVCLSVLLLWDVVVVVAASGAVSDYTGLEGTVGYDADWSCL